MPGSARTAVYTLVVSLALLMGAPPEDLVATETAALRAPRLPGVTLRGTVRLAGTIVPDRPLIENSTDPEICGATQRANDLLVDDETRGIANAIVSLRDAPGPDGPPPEASRLVLDNRDCQFVPRVAVLTVGGTIEAVSHDDMLHTVHFYGPLERNIALPDPSASVVVTVEEPGVIMVLCDLHGWMKAYVRVDAHPFHAVSDERGAFVIDNVPPGRRELDVWHERLGSQTLSVDVAAGAADEIEISYSLAGDGATITLDAADDASSQRRRDDEQPRSNQ